jgi:hypothetical protein
MLSEPQEVLAIFLPRGFWQEFLKHILKLGKIVAALQTPPSHAVFEGREEELLQPLVSRAPLRWGPWLNDPWLHREPRYPHRGV